MKYLKNNFAKFVFLPWLGLILFIYRNWFLNKEIIGGDWPYFFKEMLERFSYFPAIWTSMHGNGLGGEILTFSLDTYIYFLVSFFIDTLHFPWVFVYKLFLFGFFILLSILSSFYLFRILLPRVNPWLPFVGTLVFSTNTYILMAAGGGQIGVALSYALMPLVLGRFIKVIDGQKESMPYNSILAGLALGAQVFFDVRLAYISLIALIVYFIYRIISSKNLKKIFQMVFYFFAIPFSISFLLNSFWLLKTVILHPSPSYQYIQVQSSADIFKFFSFASFSRSISLLHPNWPENIFGKTYFLQPEFLILPILAFSSLLFLRNQRFKISQSLNLLISFLALLGLLGAFLAKGVNPPFGEVNQWLFQYIPGMLMFRDPTKFYALIAVSYSILIPYYLWIIGEKISRKIIPILLFLIFWLFLINPSLEGSLGGTFKSHNIPQDYVSLKNLIYNQKSFYRTLWIPKQQRFAFYSQAHPAVEAGPLFNTENLREIMQELKKPEAAQMLSQLSIRYLIVPYDSLGEIFLKDREYNNGQYIYLINELEKINWLTRLKEYDYVAVFEANPPKDHFWVKSESKASLSYKIADPTKYKVILKNTKKRDILVFSESYSKYWDARIKNSSFLLENTNYMNLLNSFVLPKDGDYELEISYSPQKYVEIGLWLSGLTFLGSVWYLAFGRKARKW